MILVLIPQPVAHTRRRAPGATTTLISRRAAHPHRMQSRETRRCIVARHARQSTVDHHAYAGHGEARFRHTRAQHHFARARPRRRQRGILLRQRHAAVQRVHPHAGHGVARETLGHAPLFTGARQEHQYIALGGFECFANHARRGRLDAFIATRGAIVRLDGEHAPLAAQHRRRPALVGQQRRHRDAVERSRHHQHAQFITQMTLRFQHQRQAKVGVQRPLVKLVEDYEPDVLERGIAAEHARQYPFSNHLNACAFRNACLAAHAVAHRLPHLFTQHRRHVRRRRAGREPTRFQHDQLQPRQPRFVHEHQWHARGLAGTRRRLEYRHRARDQRGAQRRHNLINGERSGRARRHLSAPIIGDDGRAVPAAAPPTAVPVQSRRRSRCAHRAPSAAPPHWA